MIKKKLTQNANIQISTLYLTGKALTLTFKLVFIPILLLFFGLLIDKKLNTTPLFIVVGFFSGMFFAVFKALDIKRRFSIK